MSSFSFWRPGRIAAAAVLAATALLLALLAPAQPSAQAQSKCRWISVTGNWGGKGYLEVFNYAKSKSGFIPINYGFGLLPKPLGGPTHNKRAFAQRERDLSPIEGSVAITIGLSQPDLNVRDKDSPVYVSTAISVANNQAELGTRKETLVAPFPMGKSATVEISAYLGHDYAKASFKVTTGGWCPT